MLNLISNEFKAASSMQQPKIEKKCFEYLGKIDETLKSLERFKTGNQDPTYSTCVKSQE
jgi:hypothetical protein